MVTARGIDVAQGGQKTLFDDGEIAQSQSTADSAGIKRVDIIGVAFQAIVGEANSLIGELQDARFHLRVAGKWLAREKTVVGIKRSVEGVETVHLLQHDRLQKMIECERISGIALESAIEGGNGLVILQVVEM